MNPANYREALIETHEDAAEGADILLVSKSLLRILLEQSLRIYFSIIFSQVKPALPYLDVIRLLRENSPLPIAAYQVPRTSSTFALTF